MKEADKFEKIKSYYDEVYNTELDMSYPCDIPRTRKILMPFLKKDVAQRTLLDIGCGAGFACELLGNKGFHVHGTDISDTALDLARGRVPNGVFFLASDDGTIRQSDGTYDHVISLGVLEHLLNPQHVINEAFRVLKPEGEALFSVPNSLSPYFFLLGGTGQVHEVPLRLQEWRLMFERAGFQLVSVGKDPGPTITSDFGPLKRFKIYVHRILNLLPISFTYQFVFILKKP